MNQSANQNIAWTRATDWLLARFTRPTTLGRKQAVVVIFIIMLTIGGADYSTGINISLTPFYFIPVLLAIAWFGWRVAAAVAVCSMGVRVVGDYLSLHGPLPLWSLWNSFSALIVFLFIIWIFSNLLVLSRRMEQRVAQRTAELLQAAKDRRQLEHELLIVGSNERNRFGQELHDDICQHLVGTALAAKVHAQHLHAQNPALVREAQEIIDLIEEGAGKARQLARGLLLAAIEPAQFAEKLNELAEEGSRSGVTCRFRQDGQVQVPDAGIAAQLYRIAQEAMRNAIKHAQPWHVDLSLGGDTQALFLTIEDDGCGMPQTPESQGMGLRIMSYRAAYIGASLSLLPMTGGGTQVVCHLPLREASA